jgi:hypothetical protein
MDKQSAIAIAKKVLHSEIELPDDDDIVVNYIEETDVGWFIEFNSKIFVETDDPMFALVTAPLMVHDDGSYHFIF